MTGRCIEHAGSFWLIVDGSMTELTFQHAHEVSDFSARLAASHSPAEQADVIRSIIRRVVATR